MGTNKCIKYLFSGSFHVNGESRYMLRISINVNSSHLFCFGGKGVTTLLNELFPIERRFCADILLNIKIVVSFRTVQLGRTGGKEPFFGS